MVDLPLNRRGEVRTKPQVILDYNVGMKGLDLSDQLPSSYSTDKKSNKWYQNVFYHLLDMAVVNGYIVHRGLGSILSQLEFHLELIADLLHQPTAYRRRGSLQMPPAAVPSPPRRQNTPCQQQQQYQQVPQAHILVFNPGHKYCHCRHC